MCWPLRFGMIGCGRAAWSMLPGLAAHSNVKLVAAAYPAGEARDRFRGVTGGRVYWDAQCHFEDEDTDAVYIATPERHVVGAMADHSKRRNLGHAGDGSADRSIGERELSFAEFVT